MHTQTQLKMNKDKILTLKNVTKSSIWELQENDVFRLWEAAEKDADLKDYQSKYIAVIRSAFEMEPVTVDRPEVIDKLMARGFKIGTFRINDKKEKYAIKKRPIMRVTDLTYENVSHITANKLIEALGAQLWWWLGESASEHPRTSSKVISTSAQLLFLLTA